MKNTIQFILFLIFAFTLSCKQKKEKVKFIPVKKEKPILKTQEKELIIVIKDATKVIDAKALIVNSGLVWNKLIIDNEALKAVSIKVPIAKTDFWVQRLKESNVFSSVEIKTKNTLKDIQYFAKNTFVSIRKGHCSGDCPVYDVTFFKDRKVIFNGVDNISIKGKQEFTITEKQQKKLIELFSKTTFKDYANSFIDKSLADFPSTFITHQNKQVEIKLWKKVPEELALAYEYLDEILLNKKLIE